MAAGAAPELPALGAFVIGLAFVLSWAIFRGLLLGYRNTLGYLLQTLGSVLDIRTWRIHIDAGKPIRQLDHAILSALAAGALKSEAGMGYFFHAAAVLAEWGFRQLEHLAAETYGWAQWLQHVHLPRWARWAVAVAFPPLLIARLVRAAVHAELPHLIRATKTVVQGATTVITQRIAVPHLGELQWIHRHWKALTAAILGAATFPLGVAAPWHAWRRWLREWDRDRLHIWRRLHRLEKLLGVTAFAGAMAAVLGLPNWRCLTRGNIGRTARALCGLPVHALEDLLGLMIDFLVITDICQVVTLLNDAFGLVQEPLAAFAGEVGGALCHGDYNAPPALSVHAFEVPPLQGRSVPVEA